MKTKSDIIMTRLLGVFNSKPLFSDPVGLGGEDDQGSDKPTTGTPYDAVWSAPVAERSIDNDIAFIMGYGSSYNPFAHDAKSGQSE